jgi:hypothetical protein
MILPAVRARSSGSAARPRLRSRGAPAMAGAVACALCCAALPVPCAAADSDFSDFRIPKNRALLWNFGLTSSANDNDQSSPSSQVSSGNLNGLASTRFSWFSDSDPAFTSLDVNVQAQGSRDHTDEHTQLYSAVSILGTSETADRAVNERWGLSAGHRRYPWAMPLGIEVSLSLGGNYSQQWRSEHSSDRYVTPTGTVEYLGSNNRETWTYLNGASVSAATGWGRVRNATGIYDAMVLEQRLRQTGALMRPLSREGRRRLAEVLYLRGALDTVRERPGRVLWREIERVLAEEGALPEGALDPYSVLRAAEPHLGASGGLTSDGIPFSPVPRQAGAFVGFVVEDRHSKSVARDDRGYSYDTITDGMSSGATSSTSSTRRDDSFDRVDGGASGEIHVPISPPWQLDASGAVLLGLREEDNYLVSNAQLSLAWLAADRWTAISKAGFSWNDEDRTQGATGGDRWSWNAGLTVNWYVEDHTAIVLSVNGRHQRSRDPHGSGSSGIFYPDVRALDATLGLTYRFSGWFATPGFFPMATALPPAPPGQP